MAIVPVTPVVDVPGPADPPEPEGDGDDQTPPPVPGGHRIEPVDPDRTTGRPVQGFVDQGAGPVGQEGQSGEGSPGGHGQDQANPPRPAVQTAGQAEGHRAGHPQDTHLDG